MLKPSRRSELEAGLAECRTLQEAVNVNMATLLKTIYPDMVVELEGLSWPKRMSHIAQRIYEEHGLEAQQTMRMHASDLVRGWACTMVGHAQLTFPEAVAALKPLILDPNPGVREWAWMALRPQVIVDPLYAIQQLEGMVHDPQSFVRRFAIEVTRPRGVWTSHVPVLKSEPWHALPLLLPLKGEQERYVQNAVANWLNDASKTQPIWVQDLCQQEDWHPYIAKRALRTLKKACLA
jgi:3-methyladenine DNA glycosylase AlkC